MTAVTVNPEVFAASLPAPAPRGPLSARILDTVTTEVVSSDAPLAELVSATSAALSASADVAHDDDLQLTLFVLYCLHYGDVAGLVAGWEWHPSLITARLKIERAFEAQLRRSARCPALPPAEMEAVAATLFQMTQPTSGPSVARYVAKMATDEQLREFLILRSIYTLKEADPHSWAIPRLHGRAKAALVEIQMDEYGQGRPHHLHSALFASTLKSLGLDTRYGAYVNVVPAITLASFNMMSMFGLNRRLRGAIVGQLAAFEMTSSIPNRLYGDGFRRLGYSAPTTNYFDIHVEADAIHEQIAARDLAGALAEDEPDLLGDIIFGAAAGLAMDEWVGKHVSEAWNSGRSTLMSAGSFSAVMSS